MRKLFTLLLLSMFLMIGTGSAWATIPEVIYVKNIDHCGLSNENDCWGYSTGNVYGYFFVAGQDGGSWSSAAEVVVGTKGTAGAVYAITVPQVAGKTWTNWILTRGTAATFDSGFWNKTGDLALPGEGKNYLTSYSQNSTTISWSVCHNVTAYIAGSGDAIANRYLHAYYNDGSNKDITTWPGLQSSESATTIDGLNYYKHTVIVPGDNPLYLIANNGNNQAQTAAITVGTITSDTTVYYETFSNFYFSLNGSFNGTGWTTNYGKVLNNLSITLPIEVGNYVFQIISNYSSGKGSADGHNWFGNSSHAVWPSDNGSSEDLYNNGGDIPLKAFVPGDYTFTITRDGDPTSVTVTYPDTYTRKASTIGAWGTICLPFATTDVTNATFYTVDYYRESTGDLMLIEVAKTNNKVVLSAGVPYIFKLNDGQNSFTASMNTTSAEAENTAGSSEDNRGLQGAYVATDVPSTGCYVIKNGVVRPAGSGVICGANKAYLVWDNVPGTSSPAPGRRLAMPMESNNATAINNVEANENVVKFVENGILYIRRAGITYDMTGRVVK